MENEYDSYTKEELMALVYKKVTEACKVKEEINKKIIEITEDKITCKVFNEFFSKIACGYLLASFSEEELKRMAEIAGCEDVFDLMYRITCTVDDSNFTSVLKSLEEKYDGCWEV